MQKMLRRLCVIPVLALVFAAVTGLPGTASANNREACLIMHWPCPEPWYDCCCGTFHGCFNSSWECDRACE